VEAVANGAQALAAIRRQRPDLVLADVMMPELDGFDLLRALRADPATATLPVILLSARAGEEATVEGLEAGADDYLVKPFSARSVLTRVAARLQIAGTRAEATRRMDEFGGIASHELRTPLTSMTANLQLARRQLGRVSQQVARLEPANGSVPTLERAELLLERAERQMVRLDRLVGDLLDVSRIQAGKLEMRPEPCDLQDIVRDMVREQRAALPARTIELELPHRGRFLATADPDRIGQVVTNLLTNALKYAPPDQPIAVRMRRRGALARVDVCDRGPGLSTEQQAHLFERFYRVPGIEQQSGSGVGLGLSLHICRTIIERHGGKVGVDSTPGVGSAFWITLPLTDDHCA
jgi:signal transduction histidine kinase